MLIAGQERSLTIEINANVKAVTFSANSEHVLSGGLNQNIGVWQVQDGQQVAAIDAQNVLCLAVSQEGKWISAGTGKGGVFVWDANTYRRVWERREGCYTIRAIDFSPNSSRLVCGSEQGKATVFGATTGQQVQTLHHRGPLTAAQFSPQGDRIATATESSVLVWNSNDGLLLVDIAVNVTPLYNGGLLWFNDHLYVVSGSTIKQLDPSAGATVSEWPVPGGNAYSCIAIPKHGKFIAYSTARTLTFWSTSTHTQLGFTEHQGDINSIALSPGDRFLTIGGEDGIIIEGVSLITVSTLPRCIMSCLTLHSSFPSSTSHSPGIRRSDQPLLT